MAASVYYGAKMQKQPRSPKEIADIFNLKLPYMTRGCKKFLTLIDGNSLFNNENNETNDFVKRYCNKLNLSGQAYLKSIEIINNINKLQIATNHQPPSVAAAAILLMADLLNISVNKKDLHTHFKISEVTIAKTYKKIHCWIRIISDSEITSEYIKEMELSLLDKIE
jgi:transcription initiation factor TFIIB